MDLGWLSAILVGAGCLALGYCIGSRRPALVHFLRHKVANKDIQLSNENNKNKYKEPLEIEKLADILDDFKMVKLSFLFCM